MEILFWGTYDTGKPRTRILRDGLRAAGVDLRECHAPVWEGIEDKSQVESVALRLRLLGRWLASYPRLVWRFLREARPDLVLVGFPGILDVLVLAWLARLRGVPIVWDLFMSLYDTAILDRRLVSASSLRARVLRWTESFALRRVRLVLLDTEAHARRVEFLHRLPAGSCRSVWVGAEVDRFSLPPAVEERSPEGPFQVLFYGQFIPLHGIETILAAARLMADQAVEWTLIGKGQEASAIRRQLEREPLAKLHWLEWVEYGELRDWLARADVCLGIFGASDKAACVIPNKVFQAVAAGRPLITRDSPAIRELLDPASDCVTLVPAGDPQALADAVRARARRKRGASSECHAALRSRIAPPAIGRRFLRVLDHEAQIRASDAR